jgi:hypothetical protein
MALRRFTHRQIRLPSRFQHRRWAMLSVANNSCALAELFIRADGTAWAADVKAGDIAPQTEISASLYGSA